MRHERVALVLAIVVSAGLAILGWQAAANLSNLGIQPAAVATITSHMVRVETRTLHRVTNGRIITLPGGTRVVHVPLLVIHTESRVIRVPAHNIPLKNATLAAPLQPVVITIPVMTTVTLPPVTTTETATTTIVSTVTIPLTIPTPSSPTEEHP
jgi:hypothetical protein